MPGEFLNAKMRGRRSLLHEGDRLRSLAIEPTVPHLAERLYPREDVPDDLSLERRLLASCVEDLAGLARFLGGSALKLYTSLLDRYRVENLKALLRLLGREGPASDILLPLPESLSIPVDDLAASPSVEEFCRRIPWRTVRECAEAALPLFRESERKAVLEMAFDQGYWTAVAEGARAMPVRRRRRCLAPVRREQMAMSLLAVMRAARVYGMSWEQVKPLLPRPVGGNGYDRLRDVHGRPEPQFAVDALPWLSGVALDAARPDDLAAFEDALWRGVMHLAARQYRAAGDGFATLISYYYFKRNEFRNLYTLAQMIRYGEPEEQIAEHLGLAEPRSAP